MPGERRRHGHAKDYRKTPTYYSWVNMRARCKYPYHTAFKYYGARGITVCERWEVFANFLEDMGERPEGMSLDRIDPDGNYEPSNCRWATNEEQLANRRPYITPRSDWTHCSRGHPFDPANTLIRKNGTRQCRACTKMRDFVRNHGVLQ